MIITILIIIEKLKEIKIIEQNKIIDNYNKLLFQHWCKRN